MKRSAAASYYPLGGPSANETLGPLLATPVCIFLDEHQAREARTRSSRRQLEFGVDDTHDQNAVNSVSLEEAASDGEPPKTLPDSPTTDEFTNSSTETILNVDESHRLSSSTSSPDISPPPVKIRRMQVGVGNSATSTTTVSANGRSVGERLKEKQKELYGNNHAAVSANNHAAPSCSSARCHKTMLPMEAKPKRTLPVLTERQKNTLRVINQYLRELGMHDTVETLTDESGCREEIPLATRLRSDVEQGDWADALLIVDEFKDQVEMRDYLTLRVCLVEELIKSHMAKGDFLAVLICLQKEYPRDKEFADRKRYFAQLLADDPKKVAEFFKDTQTRSDTEYLMGMLEDLLPPSFLLPPNRLDDLISQSWETQLRNCALHVGLPMNIVCDDGCILRDHHCNTLNFPCRTTQIIGDHDSEVWVLRFSPCGEYLASASKAGVVYIWKVKNDHQVAFYNRFFINEDQDGISSLSWSSDSKFVACGLCEHRYIGVHVMDVHANAKNLEAMENESDTFKFHDEKFSVADFFPSPGHKIVCGDHRGNFCLFDLDSSPREGKSFEGFRIRAVHCLKDGRTVLASDTQNRIRSYDFERKACAQDETLIVEESPIVSFSVDSSEKYCLITTKTHGIRMWSLETRHVVQTFLGSMHCEMVMTPCFGGQDDYFIASGSEKNNRVTIWKRDDPKPIKYLDGHKGGVNSVAWNPKFKNMLASGSDDGTIRIWSTPPATSTPYQDPDVLPTLDGRRNKKLSGSGGSLSRTRRTHTAPEESMVKHEPR